MGTWSSPSYGPAASSLQVKVWLAISTKCTNRLEHWNAFLGAASSSTAVTETSTVMDDLVCVNGTGTDNFAGLCAFFCEIGYCPGSACTCTTMGTQRDKPDPLNVDGYSTWGLKCRVLGAVCLQPQLRILPGRGVLLQSAALATPTVSPFTAPACNSGEGSGSWAGLCSYA